MSLRNEWLFFAALALCFMVAIVEVALVILWVLS